MDLKLGEIKCNVCNGMGFIKYKAFKTSRNYKKAHCEKCKGTGKFDWIERIVGKKENDLILFSPAGITRGVIHGLKTRGNYMPKM